MELIQIVEETSLEQLQYDVKIERGLDQTSRELI